jgi:hypothetical protein
MGVPHCDGPGLRGGRRHGTPHVSPETNGARKVFRLEKEQILIGRDYQPFKE